MRITGTVIAGRNRGTSLGFPTINIETTDPLPPHGIYAGWAELEGSQYQAAIHIGPVLVFNQAEISIEAHLLNFNKNVYGNRVTITCVKKLRNVSDFPTTDALIRQLHKDVEQVPHILNKKRQSEL